MRRSKPVDLGPWWVCHVKGCSVIGQRRWEGRDGSLADHRRQFHIRADGTSEPGRRPDEIPGWTDWPYRAQQQEREVT